MLPEKIPEKGTPLLGYLGHFLAKNAPSQSNHEKTLDWGTFHKITSRVSRISKVNKDEDLS